MSSETDKMKQTIRMAEIHLENARDAFDREQRERVDKLVSLADEAIRGSLADFNHALQALSQARDELVQAEKAGKVDLREAYTHMRAAEIALRQKEYGLVVEEAGLAMGKCLASPEVGKDLVLTTKLERDNDGLVNFTVKVGSNLEGRIINELQLYLLRESLPHYLVALGEEDVILEKLEPGTENFQKHIYRMEVKEELTEENETLLGRDLGFVHIITKEGKEPGLTAKIEITNYSRRTLTDIQVTPFLPEGYFAEPSSLTIDLLPDGEVSDWLLFSLTKPGDEELKAYLRKKEMEERRAARSSLPLTDETGLPGEEDFPEEDPFPEEREPAEEDFSADEGGAGLEPSPGMDQIDPLADDDDEEDDTLYTPAVESTVLEQSESEFADTKYDTELQEIETLKPSWKDELPLDEKAEAGKEEEGDDWQFPWGENGSNGQAGKEEEGKATKKKE